MSRYDPGVRRRSPLPFAIVAAVLVAAVLFGGEVGAYFGAAVVIAFTRWLLTPPGRVLLGTTCVQCGDGMFDEGRAEICPTCDAGMHARCAEAHRAKAHAAGPFR